MKIPTVEECLATYNKHKETCPGDNCIATFIYACEECGLAQYDGCGEIESNIKYGFICAHCYYANPGIVMVVIPADNISKNEDKNSL